MSEPVDDHKIHLHVETVSGEELARVGGELISWIRANTKGPMIALAALDAVRDFLHKELGVVKLKVNKIPEPAEGSKPN